MSSLLLFSQLRNNVWSSCPTRLLMQHAGLSYGKFVDPRSYEKRHFTTRVQETASSPTTGPGSCIPGIQPLKFQQTSEHEQSGTILIFDTETTGYLNKNKDNRIVELALRDLSGGKNSTFETLINPERDIPKVVSTVNNISTSLVCRPDVPRFTDLLPLLLAYVRSRQTPGKPVIWVAHKAKTFDAPFLAQEFDRCKAQMPEDWLFVDSLFWQGSCQSFQKQAVHPLCYRALWFKRELRTFRKYTWSDFGGTEQTLWHLCGKPCSSSNARCDDIMSRFPEDHF